MRRAVIRLIWRGAAGHSTLRSVKPGATLHRLQVTTELARSSGTDCDGIVLDRTGELAPLKWSGGSSCSTGLSRKDPRHTL